MTIPVHRDVFGFDLIVVMSYGGVYVEGSHKGKRLVAVRAPEFIRNEVGTWITAFLFAFFAHSSVALNIDVSFPFLVVHEGHNSFMPCPDVGQIPRLVQGL